MLARPERKLRRVTTKRWHFCPCCGSQLPDNFLVQKQFHLGAAQQALLDLVRKAGADGISSEALKTKLYAHHSDGGPLGHNIVAVMAANINKKIRKVGLQLQGTGGPGSLWHLIRATRRVERIDQQDVNNIFRSRKSLRELGALYNVSRSTIFRIKHRQPVTLQQFVAP